MKHYTQKLTRVIDNVVCDVCSKVCPNAFYLTESATIEAHWGYGSKHDGLQFEIDICEDCFMDMMGWMQNKYKEYHDTDKIPQQFLGKDYP